MLGHPVPLGHPAPGPASAHPCHELVFTPVILPTPLPTWSPWGSTPYWIPVTNFPFAVGSFFVSFTNIGGIHI